MKQIKRYERKWICNDFNYISVVNALLRSNFFFHMHFPKRKVNSLYFDDLNYSSIRQNLNSLSEKEKFRIRWYGPTNNFFNPVFEIKTRKNFEVHKKFFTSHNSESWP